MRILKNDNRGITLAELIIVISILGVVSGMFLTGLNLIFGLPARQCARELKSELEKVRIDTMGKAAGASVFLKKKTDGIYFQENYEGISPDERDMADAEKQKEKKIGTDRVTIQCNGSPLPESMEIAFQRETGGLKKPSSTEDLTFSVKSGSHTWNLKISHLTGKIELEKSK